MTWGEVYIWTVRLLAAGTLVCAAVLNWIVWNVPK